MYEECLFLQSHFYYSVFPFYVSSLGCCFTSNREGLKVFDLVRFVDIHKNFKNLFLGFGIKFF